MSRDELQSKGFLSVFLGKPKRFVISTAASSVSDTPQE